VKDLLQRPMFNLSGERYLLIVIIVAPLLNFIFGISVDLYAPSVPAITSYFHTSEILAKQGFSSIMLGFCLGCLVLGPMMDDYGRRKVILISLLFFILVSLLALEAGVIRQLTTVRVLQGIAIAASSIGSRVLIFDNFKGDRYAIGIVYTSFAYAVGPIIAPFVGGWLQSLFGWQSIFIAYASMGLFVFILFFFFIKESKFEKKSFSLSTSIKEYWTLVCNKTFFSGGVILGIAFFQFVSFSVLGTYFYSQVMGLTSVNFGNSALLLGVTYLFSTLINRVLIPRFSIKKICSFGFLLLLIATLIYIFIALKFPVSESGLVIPGMLIVFSIGFIFPNVLGASLKLFPGCVGVAAAAQSLLFMLVSLVVTSVVNHLNMHERTNIAILYTVLFAIQIFMFLKYFVRAFKE
jgi:MFS transporter, DHA1 family, multidrug resistance protein